MNSRPSRWLRDPWLPAIALAVLGAAIRAPGLGQWSFAVDEYYSWQATQFIVERGWPTFPGGGAYSRGLFFHLASAFLAARIDDPELGMRIIPWFTGSLVLPLFYLFARRFLTPGLAFSCALALALSSWQIEFARFGRMYAAAQLVFLGAVLLLYRGRFEGDRRAALGAWVLAFFALFVHETALLLIPLYALTPSMRARSLFPALAKVMVPASVLLVAAYFVLWFDWQFRDIPPPLPPGVESDAWSSPLVAPSFWMVRAMGHSFGPVLVVPWLGLLAWAVRLSRRSACGSLASSIGIHAVLAAALAQQVGVACLVVIFFAFTDEHFRRTLWERRFGWLAFLVAATAFWVLAGVALGGISMEGAGISRILKESAKAFLFYPEIVQRTVLPLIRPTPGLALVVYGAVVLGLLRMLSGRPGGASSFPLFVMLVGMTVVGWIPAPYYESRYFFVLYPFFLLVAWVEWGEAGRWLAERGFARAPRFAVAVPLVAFFAGGDFHAAHVLDVASREHAHRLGSYERYQRHWYPRADFENPALWVNEHYVAGDEVVVDVVPSVAYLTVPHAYFMESGSPEFPFASSLGGSRYRWTEAPLIHDFADFARAVPVDPERSLWLITVVRAIGGSSFGGEHSASAVAERFGLEAELAHLEPDGRIGVWRFTRAGS